MSVIFLEALGTAPKQIASARARGEWMVHPGQGAPSTLARTAAAGLPALLAVPQETVAADMGPTVVEQARQSGGSGVTTPTNGVDFVSRRQCTSATLRRVLVLHKGVGV